MQNLKDLELLLESSVPIIVIESREEARLIELFKRIIKNIAKPLFLWTVTEGLKRLDVDMPAQRHNRKPVELLTQIKITRHEGIYLLLDFHPFLEDPLHIRLMKDIALRQGNSCQHIVRSPTILNYRKNWRDLAHVLNCLCLIKARSK